MNVPLPTRASRRTAVLAWLIAAAVSSPFCFNAVQEVDIGWHVALGRIIVGQHTIPRTNLLTWTEPDFPYYPTSWLFDIIAQEVVTLFGPAGLQAFTCVLLLLTLAGVTVACSRLHRFGPWLVPATALLLIPRVTPRPHMMSWVVEAWVVAFGVLGRELGWKWRLACVPLIALGSNSHAGAIFAAGALGLFCLEAAWRERRWGREALICVAAGVALVANPGGLYNVLYAFGNLSVYKQLPVEEMKPPSVSDLPAFFVMIPLALLAGIAQLRKRPVMLPLAIVFSVLGLFAVRLAFEFYLVAVPVLAGAIEPLEQKSGTRAVGLVFALLVTLAGASMIQRVALLSPRLDWDESVLPVRAAKYIAQRKLDGQHFNSFEDGGYLECALPNLRAFQDGRIQAFSPEFFEREIAASADPATFQAYLRRLGVEWALATSSQHGFSGNGMLQSPDWALVYWDDASEIYVRRDVARLRDLVAQDEMHYFVPTTSAEAIVKAVASLSVAETSQLKHEIERFEATRPGNATAALSKCAALTRLKSPDAPRTCDAAADRDGSNEWQALVRSARTIPPAI